MLNLQFKSYQDVKNTLYWYTYCLSIILSLLAYFTVIPQQHRLILNTLFGNITNIVPAGVIITVLFGFIISFMFVHMFALYDRVYDRFIIRWRYKYAKNFIMPELFGPFGDKLDIKFFETASKNMKEFMNIFYNFVGDYDVRIRKTAVVRFYDAVWKYWATQINEMFFIMFVIVLVGYMIYCASNNLPINFAVAPSIVIVVLGILNRVISWYFLRYVHEATGEEIKEIHDKFMGELEEKTENISRKFNLSYGND